MAVTCGDLMKTDVETVTLRDTVQRAARIMRDIHIGFLPVVDDAMHVLGTVTDRDITIRIVADNLPNTVQVKECMTHEIVSCRRTDNLDRAIAIMSERQKSRLMVLDNNDRLIGVISLSDIVEALDPVRAGQVLQNISAREIHA